MAETHQYPRPRKITHATSYASRNSHDYYEKRLGNPRKDESDPDSEIGNAHTHPQERKKE